MVNKHVIASEFGQQQALPYELCQLNASALSRIAVDIEDMTFARGQYPFV